MQSSQSPIHSQENPASAQTLALSLLLHPDIQPQLYIGGVGLTDDITARLFEIRLVPMTPIRDAVEELAVLGSGHGIDGDVEVPGLAHIVELA